MIAEWFYPKELKEIIRDLEAQGNLRREPLVMLNYETMFMICVIAISVAIVTNSDGVLTGIAIFILMSCSLFLNNYFIFTKFKVYIYGTSKSGFIDKITYKYRRNTVIYLIIPDAQKKRKTARIGKIIGEKHGVKIGRKIQFFEIDSKWLLPMPDIHIVKEYYCLRKDLMDQTSTSP
ncbi:MAG: hypothetical protein COB36_07300 [Alphaproteobacteria bacterium]|nr:MAG: hypothetical protein COB36_07300 [Alphaproteobacteria bacterium]